MNCENQYRLQQIHGLIFEEAGAAEDGEKILFNPRKTFISYGITGDENEFNRPGKIILMTPEGFPKQSTGTITLHRSANLFAGNNTQPRHGICRQTAPVGNQTTLHQPFTLLPNPREIAALRQTR